MTNAQLFEAIFRRKSVRKYDMNPLGTDVLAQLQSFVKTIKPLDDSIPYEFAYLDTDEVKNILPIKAPHYICIYSKKKDNYLMNAGFVLQQVDLYLSANSIGSCWLGMAKPSKEVPEFRNGLEFVIMLAFGNASEPVHRDEISEFKRNGLSEITTISEMEELLDPVRLAPSASNTQTWYFSREEGVGVSGGKDTIIVSRKKLNILKAPLYGKMNQIDIGIALQHLALSLEHQNKVASYDYHKSTTPAGYEFMVKVVVEEKKS